MSPSPEEVLYPHERLARGAGMETVLASLSPVALARWRMLLARRGITAEQRLYDFAAAVSTEPPPIARDAAGAVLKGRLLPYAGAIDLQGVIASALEYLDRKLAAFPETSSAFRQRLVGEVIASWVEQVAMLVRRFADDRAAGLLPDFGDVRLLRLELGLGDPHGRAGGTAICHLETGRLLYKPRDAATELALDRMLTDAETGIGLPVARVPQLVSRRSYFWQRFVAAIPMTEASPADVKSAGALIAVMQALAVTDLHADNLCLTADGWRVLDGETLFASLPIYTEERRAFRDLALDRAYAGSAQVTGLVPDIQALMGRPAPEGVGLGELLARNDAGIAERIADGYAQAARLFSSRFPVIDPPQELHTRVILRDTDWYGALFRDSLSEGCMTNPVDRFLLLDSHCLSTRGDGALLSAADTLHETLSLLSGSVPAFVAESGSRKCMRTGMERACIGQKALLNPGSAKRLLHQLQLSCQDFTASDSCVWTALARRQTLRLLCVLDMLGEEERLQADRNGLARCLARACDLLGIDQPPRFRAWVKPWVPVDCESDRRSSEGQRFDPDAPFDRAWFRMWRTSCQPALPGAKAIDLSAVRARLLREAESGFRFAGRAIDLTSVSGEAALVSILLQFAGHAMERPEDGCQVRLPC